MPTATPETPYPTSQASQAQSVVSVKPLTSNTESLSSRMGSVPGVGSLSTWPADPSTLTSHCSCPCPLDHTCVTEHSTSSTQSVREFFTSSAAAFTVMSAGCSPESAATGPSLPLSLDSTTTQCPSSRGAPEDVSGPMCDRGHVPDQDLLKSLEGLAQRGDDAHLPQYLHQVTTVMCKSGMKSQPNARHNCHGTLCPEAWASPICKHDCTCEWFRICDYICQLAAQMSPDTPGWCSFPAEGVHIIGCVCLNRSSYSCDVSNDESSGCFFPYRSIFNEQTRATVSLTTRNCSHNACKCLGWKGECL